MGEERGMTALESLSALELQTEVEAEIELEVEVLQVYEQNQHSLNRRSLSSTRDD